MSTTHMSFSDQRARTELGYTSRPAAEALSRAARWFVDEGYVRRQRAARFVWARRARPGLAERSGIADPPALG